MRWRRALLVLLPLALGACAHLEPVPPATPGRTAEEKAALYQRFHVQKDINGTYHIQGRAFSSLWALRALQEADPDSVPPQDGSLFRWRDLAWAGALIGSTAWYIQSHPVSGSIPSDYGLSTLAFNVSFLGWIFDGIDRMQRSADQRIQAWDRALAHSLEQPETAWEQDQRRYVDRLPGWKLGLGYSSTYRSGADYQDYFSPSPPGYLNFRYSDPWTEGVQASVGYGFASAWSLELEAEGVGQRDSGVIWGLNKHTEDMEQYVYQSSLRVGRAWDWRVGGPTDLSLMPFAGLGLGWMRGTATERDVAGTLIGSSVLRSTAPAGLVGLRGAVSWAPHIAYTLEAGYRWLRFDYGVVTEASGTYIGQQSPELSHHNTQAFWDHSGPFLKVGILFL
jgi:hypothetical protein